VVEQAAGLGLRDIERFAVNAHSRTKRGGAAAGLTCINTLT
jgi:hypothetical protein